MMPHMHRNCLRVARAERRITQLDLAHRIGINPGRYWKIENGYVEPTSQERSALARALKKSVAELFPGIAREQVAS